MNRTKIFLIYFTCLPNMPIITTTHYLPITLLLFLLINPHSIIPFLTAQVVLLRIKCNDFYICIYKYKIYWILIGWSEKSSHCILYFMIRSIQQLPLFCLAFPGETPHRCDICSKTFTRKEHLLNHVRQHTGESPHRCTYCPKTFTRKEHLTNHIHQHTGETCRSI